MEKSASNSVDKPTNPNGFVINEKYRRDEFKNFVQSTLNGETPNSHPFPHFSLNEFIVSDKKSEVMENLKIELASSKFVEQNNDLHSIQQTTDVANLDDQKFPTLKSFHNFMRTTVREFIQKVTGFALNEKVALTGSLYKQGDYLLPHDDSLDTRKVAFVLYLSKDWEEKFGGELALFNSNSNINRPIEVTKRLQPIYNTFVFFPVTTNTWHSVEEVLDTSYSRLSLNGWFHADDAKAAAPPLPEPEAERIRLLNTISMKTANEWFNQRFLNTTEIKKIKRTFESTSEISFPDFLTDDKYNLVLDELDNAHFNDLGPPDQRNVAKLDESMLTPGSNLSTLLEMFRSEMMTSYLTKWTGLQLSEDQSTLDNSSTTQPNVKRIRLDTEVCKEPTTSAKTQNEIAGSSKADVELVPFVYRFKHGSYTMTDDQMAARAELNGYCLDDISTNGQKKAHGFTSYVGTETGNDEAEPQSSEILRVYPKANALQIVFRERNVVKFTKYLNCHTESRYYYLVGTLFYGVHVDSTASSPNSRSSDEDREEQDYDEDLEAIEDDDLESNESDNDRVL
ncbi:hypothetical protein M3Y98_00554100 [Aphelenchoides besseyi]|nr:hypothetical protein M3Y98_00554100 [Aphelenchoides besseyi]